MIITTSDVMKTERHDRELQRFYENRNIRASGRCARRWRMGQYTGSDNTVESSKLYDIE